MKGLLAAVGGLAFTALLVHAVQQRPEPAIDLRAQVAAQLPASGVDHPVTAVLLNFRGYDTLLEIAVLLVAVTAGLCARHAQPDYDAPRHLDNPLLDALLHGLVPLALMRHWFAISGRRRLPEDDQP